VDAPSLFCFYVCQQKLVLEDRRPIPSGIDVLYFIPCRELRSVGYYIALAPFLLIRSKHPFSFSPFLPRSTLNGGVFVCLERVSTTTNHTNRLPIA
jgi:hypothetical protein